MTTTAVRWEYKVVELKERKFSGPLRDRLEDVLNEHGKEGWHLTGLISGDTAGWTGRAEGLIVTFERPLS